MKIVGKREEFMDWLEKIAVGDTFEIAVVKVTPNEIISSNTENIVYRYLKYNKLTTAVGDNESGIIKFQVGKLYQTIDKLFNDDEKITVEVKKENGDEVLVISSGRVERKQPLFSIEPEEMEDVDRLRFKVENGTPFLSKGTIQIKNKVKVGTLFLKKMISVASLQDIISRWRFSIINGKFVVEVGDILNGRDIVKLTPEKVKVNADHNITVDFGLQLKNIAKVFKTDVSIFLENNLPGIFHENTMNYELWIMISHIMPEDIEEAEIEADITMAQADAEAQMQVEEQEKEEIIAQQEQELEMGDI